MKLFPRYLILALALWGAWAPCAFARPVMVLRTGEDPDPDPPPGSPRFAPAAVITVADEGSLNFTPTILDAAGGHEFTVSGLPAGASYNSSTGQLTGTLSTPGTYDVTITATGITHPARVRIVVYASTVTIDATWLANAANQETAYGETVYVLKTAYCRYVLAQDVSCDGNAFYIANQDILFDLNGHTITYNLANLAGATVINEDYWGMHGIVFWRSNGVSPEVDGGLTDGVKGWRPTLINGEIINANAGGLSHGVYGHYALDSLIERVRIETDGKDSHAVYLRWADDPPDTGESLMRDNVFITHTADTFNRHDGPACIGCKSGQITFERNIILGGNSGIFPGSESIIVGNVFGHSGFVTNGYAVFTYDLHDVLIADNLMLPTNGRGMNFDGNHDNIGTRNVILHLEHANVEFGDALNPPAFRSRWGAHDHEFTDNVTLGIGGGDDHTSASSIYLTLYGTAGPLTIEGNHCTTILIGDPDQDHYAQPFTNEGTGYTSGSTGPGLSIVRNNVLRSNNYLIRLEGYDGNSRQSTPLAENEFSWVDGSTAYADFMDAVNAKFAVTPLTAAVEAEAEAHIAAIDTLIEGLIAGVPLHADRATWYLKADNHNGQETNLDTVDSDWGSVNPRTYDYLSLYSGSVKARDSFTQSVQILDGGLPVTGVTVTNTSNQGDVSTAVTDGTGHATLTFYRFAITKANGSGSAFSVVDRTSSTVSYNGKSAVITHSAVPASVEID